MNAPVARACRATLSAWLLLGATLLGWPWLVAGSAVVVPLLALAFLLLPLGGFRRAEVRTLRWAPLTLAPALLLALTEVIANPAARRFAGLLLALVLIAFAADLAWLRAAVADSRGPEPPLRPTQPPAPRARTGS